METDLHLPGSGTNKEALRLKQQINPAAAGAIIVVIVLVVAVLVFRGGQAQSHEGEKPPGIPPDAAAELQRKLGGASTTAPVKPGGAGASK